MPSKVTTPGYKAILISQASFEALQLLQKAEKPARLSVADLADAAIALQLDGGQNELLIKAKELVIASFIQSNSSR